MTKQEYITRYGEEWYNEHILKHNTNYYQDNKDKVTKYHKQHYKDNKEKYKQYYKDNKEKLIEYYKQYMKDTQIGRANHILQAYKRNDKKYNRGECTLTADWIVNNIFNSKCVFCGESDWKKLGCDRIDNSKPHTPENVQCCCRKCNVKKSRHSIEEFLDKMDT